MTAIFRFSSIICYVTFFLLLQVFSSGQHLATKGALFALLLVSFSLSVVKWKQWLLKERVFYVLPMFLYIVVHQSFFLANNFSEYYFLKFAMALCFLVCGLFSDRSLIQDYFKSLFYASWFIVSFSACLSYKPFLLGFVPYLLISRSNVIRPLACLSLVFLCFWWNERAMMFVFLMLPFSSLLKFKLVQWLFAVSLIALVLWLLWAGINSDSHSLLDSLLTKRLTIWDFYLTELLSSNLAEVLFGKGRIDTIVATNAGEFVGARYEVSRQYSAHSLYVATLYEYGLFGVSLYIFVPLILVLRSVGCKDLQLFIVLLIAGLVSPMEFFSPLLSSFLILLSMCSLFSCLEKGRAYENSMPAT